MPKQKTKSGAKKRFSLTATGKIKRAKMNRRHILSKRRLSSTAPNKRRSRT